MFYDLAIGIYDLLVHLAAPFSRKPRKMMKGHWVVYELLRQQLEKDARLSGFTLPLWESLNRDAR